MIHRIPLLARWPPVLTHYALTTRICDLAIWRGYAKVATRAPAPGRSHETTNGNSSTKT